MASTASTWLMTEAQEQGRGYFQRDIITNAPWGIVDGTQKRDVSESLDLLALADTPFINKIGWGPESGGNKIEWVTEDLGPGIVTQQSITVSADLSLVLSSIDGLDASLAIYQIRQGSVLYTWDSTEAAHMMAVVTSMPGLSNAADCSIHVSWISGTKTSMPAAQKHYVLGAYANEGSIPGKPAPRQRGLCSNAFTILREDVQITGTMKSTDMYVIGREDRHQILMRLKELQRNRERAALYSTYIAKTSAMAGMINGVFGFLNSQTGSHIDTSTYSLTESAVNTVVSKVWEYGGRNLSFFGHINQTAKFTRWDKNRIRTRINEGRGGGRITSYLTEAGIEIDLIPMALVPTNLAFVLDTSKINLRAKRGRKAIMEKLGKMGDFDDWQILSEFSLEMRGYNQKQHGMFTKLT
ncbi:MAG: DUF5309 family protein [Deltaproteobacteria bacterium]|nr:DUF5309 family protein [Deltaproteobacteria bacterium]